MGKESREERKEQSSVVYCMEFRPSGKIKTPNKTDISSSYKKKTMMKGLFHVDNKMWKEQSYLSSL